MSEKKDWIYHMILKSIYTDQALTLWPFLVTLITLIMSSLWHLDILEYFVLKVAARSRENGQS